MQVEESPRLRKVCLLLAIAMVLQLLQRRKEGEAMTMMQDYQKAMAARGEGYELKPLLKQRGTQASFE